MTPGVLFSGSGNRSSDVVSTCEESDMHVDRGASLALEAIHCLATSGKT